MISVLLATHNSHPGRLGRTVDALCAQTLDTTSWELIVTDNASSPPLNLSSLNVPASVNVRLVREDKPGLIHARMAGIMTSVGDIILFCDDDTVLDADYLAFSAALFEADSRLGNAAGQSLPNFEITPPDWVREFADCLALRDFGDECRVIEGTLNGYPSFAFGGGGAAFRRAALALFEARYADSSGPILTGRSGTSLASGEDNTLVLSVLEAGWKVGYFPELTLTHLIPAGRLETAYLGRLNRGIAKSWVEVLGLHDICPWTPAAPWTLPLRKARSYLRNRAWAGPAEYVRWQGACGHFEGRASLNRIRARHAA